MYLIRGSVLRSWTTTATPRYETHHVTSQIPSAVIINVGSLIGGQPLRIGNAEKGLSTSLIDKAVCFIAQPIVATSPGIWLPT
jgi:hypothetical protein